MASWTRRSRAWVVALAALALLAPATVDRAPAVAQAGGSVVDVLPRPAAVVDLAGVVLEALVATDADVEEVTVTVDDTPVDATTTARSTGTAVRAALPTLAPGLHQLAVVATTADGDVARRWGVTATDVTVARLAGADRHATAVAVSQEQFPVPHDAPVVVLARADAFADALAGGPLAHHLGGPLLLTDPDVLPSSTRAEIDRVLAEDGTVHVLGGRVAVDEDVVAALEEDGHRVVRHGGSTRYDTAVAIARQLPRGRTAVVASGRAFPDALAASVPAAREGWPVLLTERDALPTETRNGIDTLGLGAIVVVGGEAAVGQRVVDELRGHVSELRRVAGEDRYATARAIADAFLTPGDEVALASGTTFPDALAASVRAARRAAPLLLTDPGVLPRPTDQALRAWQPTTVTVHGGPVAVHPDVEAAARRAVVDGVGAPRVVAASPGSGATSPTLAPITLSLSRALVADTLEASVTLDDVELPTTVRLDGDGTRVVVDPLSPGDLPLDRPHEVVVRVRGADADGRGVHHLHRFTLQEDDHVFATVGDIELVEPSSSVEVVGYHQSNHEGAQQMTPAPDGPDWVTMSDRGRLTGSRSAADVVADPDREVLAPVTGRVVRSGTYVLYCDHTDNFLAIEPDGHPGIEVKMLHFRGLRVSPGDRVVGGETVVGDGPRQLPFGSQVDAYSDSGHGPHVHVELVDTSIPNVPNGGSGSEDC